MVGHGDPVRYGLITNLARPEGNVTGVSFLVNEVAVKTVELLKEAIPRIGRIAVFVNSDNPGARPVLEAIRGDAPKIGLTVDPADVKTPDELEAVVNRVITERVDAIFLGPEALLITHRQRIIVRATARRIPVAGPNVAFAESGALLSYAPESAGIVRSAVRYVDRLLRGAKPGELPVEQPARFELVLNARTATALGMVLPPTLVLRADRVIE